MNMLPLFNGELEHAADLYKVCASVAHQKAEVGAIFAAETTAVFPHPRHLSDFAPCVSEGEIAATRLPFPECP